MSRMFPELLRFSSSSRLIEMVHEDLKNAHRPSVVTGAPTPIIKERRMNLLIERRDRGNANKQVAQAPLPVVDLWDGWGDGVDADEGAGSAVGLASDADPDDSDGDLDLTEMGL